MCQLLPVSHGRHKKGNDAIETNVASGYTNCLQRRQSILACHNMECGLTGRCDFCQFSNLKLSPLTCMRHFYCQTCRKYVTRLQKKDFSCKLCMRKQRQIQSERRRESHILDSFIEETATERRARHFHEVPITISGAQVIPLHGKTITPALYQ